MTDWEAYAATQPINEASIAAEPVQQLRIDKMSERCVGTVLNVGAGDGYGNPPGAKAVDISTTRVGRMREQGIDAIVADACDLPFGDDSYDTVLLGEIMEHVDNPGVVFAEACRVAKERVVMSVPLNGWADPTHQWRISLDICEDPNAACPTKTEQVVMTWQRGDCWPAIYFHNNPEWQAQFGLPWKGTRT